MELTITQKQRLAELLNRKRLTDARAFPFMSF